MTHVYKQYHVIFQVDDQIRQLNCKLPPDERESAIAIIEHSGPPPDACQSYAQLSGVAAVLSMYYALHVGGGGGIVRGRGDTRGLMRVLPTLPNCQAHRAFEDPFLHTLVIGLLHLIYRILVTTFIQFLQQYFLMNYRFHY